MVILFLADGSGSASRFRFHDGSAICQTNVFSRWAALVFGNIPHFVMKAVRMLRLVISKTRSWTALQNSLSAGTF